MKVKAFKSIIKEAVKEAVVEVLSDNLNNTEVPNSNIPSSPQEQVTPKKLPTENPLQEVLQETYHTMKSNPGEADNFNVPDFNVDLTSEKAQAFSPQQHLPVDTGVPAPSSKFEQDMMKKTAAIVDQMKKTGKLNK